MNAPLKILALAITVVALAACGGGGGGSDNSEDNPPPSSSNWDEMVWDQDDWS